MPGATPASWVTLWAEGRKPLPIPSCQIADFGALDSAATEFVIDGGGCSDKSAAPVTDVIGAAMITLRTPNLTDAFISQFVYEMPLLKDASLSKEKSHERLRRLAFGAPRPARSAPRMSSTMKTQRSSTTLARRTRFLASRRGISTQSIVRSPSAVCPL